MFTSPSGTSRLHLLDGMRGLAAFAVIVDHVPSEPLMAVLPGRYLAVDFFFVLSGLVLARAYGESLSAPGGVSRFLKLRLIRLYPMYLLGFGIGLAVTLFATLRGWNEFSLSGYPVSALAGLLFLPSPATFGTANDVLFPFDPPAWTLLFELIANFAWALAAFLFRGRVRIILLLLFAAWAAVSVYNAPVQGAGWEWTHLNTGLARVFFSFFAGVALHSVLGRISLPQVPAIIPVLMLAFVLMCPAGTNLRPTFDVTAMIVIIPATVLLAAHTRVSGRVAGSCDWLGSVSYGVYVLHFPLFLALSTVLGGFGLSTTLLVMILAVVSALTAHLAAIIYEKPLQRHLRDLIASKKQ